MNSINRILKIVTGYCNPLIPYGRLTQQMSALRFASGWSPPWFIKGCRRLCVSILTALLVTVSPLTSAQSLNPGVLVNLLDALFEDVLDDGVIALSTNKTSDLEYGANYGSNEHPLVFNGAIWGSTDEMVLSVTGYDIDHNREIGVYVNGILIGYLLPTGGEQEGQTTHFKLPAGTLDSGYNDVDFRAEAGSDATWGITNLLVENSGPAVHLSHS